MMHIHSSTGTRWTAVSAVVMFCAVTVALLGAPSRATIGLIVDPIEPIEVRVGASVNYPNPPSNSVVFYLNGSPTPVLRLYRETEYTFMVYTDSDNPFYITNYIEGGLTGGLAERTYAGGPSFYAAGFSSPAIVRFTPRTRTPEALYYMSTNNVRVGWRIYIRDRPQPSQTAGTVLFTTSTTTTSTTTPDFFSRFELVHTGFPSSNPTRFSTAFNDKAIIGVFENTDAKVCAAYCADEFQCLGYFVYASLSKGYDICHTLSNLGGDGGVVTSSISASYRHTDPNLDMHPFLPSSLNGFDIAFQGKTVADDNQEPLRFSTAFEIGQYLAVISDADIDMCAEKCLNEPACVALFAWIKSSGTPVCHLLASIGEGEGVQTSSVSISFIRKEFDLARYSFPGYQVRHIGALPGTLPDHEPRRFSTTFQPRNQVVTLEHITLSDCVAECTSLFHCLGFTYWIPADEIPRCIILGFLGVPGSTTSVSIGFSRDIALQPPLQVPFGYLQLYEGDTGAPTFNSPLRFSTAFDIAYDLLQIDAFFDESMLCAEECDNLADCEGYFYQFGESNDQTCTLLSSIGTKAVDTNSHSYSIARIPNDYVLRFEGNTATNSGVDDFPLRFSTAFDIAFHIANIENITLMECGAACSSTDECRGIFYWFKNSEVIVCVLLSDVGSGEGNPTSSNSFSLERIL